MAKKPASTRKVVDKSRATRRLRVASYNINGITSRLEILLRWLGEFQPDIVALQELKTLDENFPAHAPERGGHANICHRPKP
jgi:exodeoxyribonuclease-3